MIPVKAQDKTHNSEHLAIIKVLRLDATIQKNTNMRFLFSLTEITFSDL